MTPPDTDIDDVPQDETQETPKLSLEVKVESPSACQRHLTVTVPREDVDRYYDEAFTELMPDASVPGFRSGRAPRKLVEQRYRKDVTDKIKGSILMDSLGQITEEQEFSAISEPDFDFDAIDLPDDGPLTFEFDLEVRPEFDLPKWKGLKLERPVHQFTSRDVDHHLQKMLQRHGMLVPVDGPAERDDYVVLNLSFKHDGKPVSEAREQTVRIKPTLSFHDGNLDGFDELLVGASLHDTRQAKVTVSADAANEELHGAQVDVALEVLEIKKLELPELNDAFLKELGDFENEGDLRDGVKDALERQLTYRQQRSVRQQIAALLTESATWELPPEMLRRQARRELDRAILELKSSGFDEDQIRAHENELRQNSLASTETALKEHFILERIAEEESVDVSEEDYDVEIELIAAQSNEPSRRVRARLEKRGAMDALRNQIVERKVISQITQHAQFKDVEYEPEEDETEAIDLAICAQRETEIPEAKHGGEAQELPELADHD